MDHPHWKPLIDHILQLIHAEDFQQTLGGSIFILENFSDFMYIEFMKFDDNNFKDTNLVLDAGTFDIARKLDGSDWYEFHSINSNSGGPVWFIPEHLARFNENVAKSIELS